MVSRWIPMKSDFCSGAPSASKQSSTASRIRSMTSRRERPCAWQAGIAELTHVMTFRVALDDDIELAWRRGILASILNGSASCRFSG
jgi:hypothetical protein